MKDYDFTIRDYGSTITLTTHNWKTVDWIRNNREEQGTVTGGVYATISGPAEKMSELINELLAAGLTMPANRKFAASNQMPNAA